MRADVPEEVTQLLVAYSTGDRDALNRLMPHLYDPLRQIAHRHLRQERPDHTLNTTALVHEAYLGGVKRVVWGT